MIYKVTVSPEIASAIEAKAAEKDLTPERFLVEHIERTIEQHEASEAEILRMVERGRARQAKIEEGKRVASI